MVALRWLTEKKSFYQIHDGYMVAGTRVLGFDGSADQFRRNVLLRRSVLSNPNKNLNGNIALDHPKKVSTKSVMAIWLLAKRLMPMSMRLMHTFLTVASMMTRSGLEIWFL